MNRKRILLGLISIAVALCSAPAQERNSGELTIEELYLQNAEIRIIREQAITQDRDMKLMALDNIQEMLYDGKISSGTSAKEAHYILDYLAGEGLTRMVRESNRLVNYFPEVRRRAVNLLGQLGSEEAKESLLDILLTDIEPMVLAEAAYALGSIGTNDDNRTSTTIAAVLIAQDSVAPDNNFAFASLLAFEKLAETNGGLNDPLAFEAIIRVAQGNYIRSVKIKAVEVLDLLRTY
jgi:HEAT repeat protein